MHSLTRLLRADNGDILFERQDCVALSRHILADNGDIMLERPGFRFERFGVRLSAS
jgi:hypothetical protein